MMMVPQGTMELPILVMSMPTLPSAELILARMFSSWLILVCAAASAA